MVEHNSEHIYVGDFVIYVDSATINGCNIGKVLQFVNKVICTKYKYCLQIEVFFL